MEKKILSIIFILVLSSISYTLNLQNVFSINNFSIDFNAYNGSDYYPERDHNEFNYREILFLDFGWDYYLEENTNVWLDFSYSNEMFSKKIEIKSIGFSHFVNKWQVKYSFSNLRYSINSRLLQLNVNSKYFNQPVFIDFRFNGASLGYTEGPFSYSISGGGNQFNSALIHTLISYNSSDLDLDLFSIYVSRDNLLNKKSVINGLEIIKHNKYFFLYSSIIYHAHINDDNKKFDSLNEIIIYPKDNIFCGTNIIYSITDWREHRDWTSRTSLGLDIDKLSFILSYEYQNTEETASNWGNRKLNFLTIYNLTKSASVGFDMNYFNPTYDKTHYQFGIQGKIKYENL